MKLLFEQRSLPKVGERENGDAVLVQESGEGTLIAVIDALGHGSVAASVSKLAVDYLRLAQLDGGLRAIIDGLHHALRSSRGAAAMVCSIRGSHLDGCGVGNVDLRAHGVRIPVVLTPGVLGRTVHRPRFFEAELAPGNRLLFFTDGISSRFDSDAFGRLPASEACEALMSKHRHAHDDATVLITDIEA